MSNKIIYVYYPDIRILFYIHIKKICFVPWRWKMFIIFGCEWKLLKKNHKKNLREFLMLLNFHPLEYSTGSMFNVVELSLCYNNSYSFFQQQVSRSLLFTLCIVLKNKNKPEMPTFSLQCVFELERKRKNRQIYDIALKIKTRSVLD